MIYVAGLGDGAGKPGGVSIFDDDLRPVGAGEPIDELLYIDLDPAGEVLYGVSGVQEGRVHAWRIAGSSLLPIGDPVPSGGREPCHLAVDSSGRFLLVANYGASSDGSVAVLPIGKDGRPGPATVIVRDTPPGPDPDRQGESHIHQVVLAGDDEVLVVDLGGDEVVSYLLRDGALVDPVVSAAPAGSGPRHLRLGHGNQVLLSGELASTLIRAEHQQRRLVGLTSVPSTGRQVEVPNFPSDVQVDGDRVYVANRGANSVAVVSATTGELLGETPCAAWPRQFALAGGRLYVAGTNANEVGVIGAADLVAMASIAVAQPMCVVVTGAAARRG